jgi:hypothetical protein
MIYLLDLRGQFAGGGEDQRLRLADGDVAGLGCWGGEFQGQGLNRLVWRVRLHPGNYTMLGHRTLVWPVGRAEVTARRMSTDSKMTIKIHIKIHIKFPCGKFLTCRTAVENVAVLPVPDCAWAMASRPLMMGLMARCCMADGFSKP